MVSSILRPWDCLPSDTHAHTIAGTVKMVILLMIRSYVTTDCKTGRSSWSNHMNLLKTGFPTQLWGRRPMPPHPQDKVVGDLSPADQYPKTRMAGQLREEPGPCLDRAKRPHISHSQSPATSRLHVLRKLLGGLEGSAAHWCQATRRPLWWSPPWLRRCVHTWKDSGLYQIWALNQVNKTDWP